MTTTDPPLFDGFEPAVPVSAEPVSADRRRTQRQAAAIANGIHPYTHTPLHPLASWRRDAQAPKTDPFTCGSCYFREPGGFRGFPKCTRFPGLITHGPGSDIRAWWPACPDYSPSDSISPDAARYIPE